MLSQAWLRWVPKHLQILSALAALLPAVWLLAHPVPVGWLRPLCKDTWPVLALSALAAILPFLCHRKGVSAWSLSVIALTYAVFQSWCYNTGSHPAHNQFQAWGILPASDANLYYTCASELLRGQQIPVMAGARHSYPLVLALLLKIFRQDFRLVTLLCTIVIALATWSVFEVIRLRLGGLAAAVYLICVTFYIRTHCIGLFMTEQLAVMYSLCAVGMLVHGVASEGELKAWFYCGGVFFLTQALNARPAAYLTLPFLVALSWRLSGGSLATRGKIVILSAIAVGLSFLLNNITCHRVVDVRAPSNGWYCIYGLLNGGGWQDGRKRVEEIWQNRFNLASGATIVADVIQELKEECLSEIRGHPSKLLRGWWRGIQYVWSKNTPFRSTYPEMPAGWFTESARWCTVLGFILSLLFLFSGDRLPQRLKAYQALSWLNLAGLAGTIFSLPFAPPWDGETRIFAATLPLFFLLPAFGVGGLCLLITNRFHRAAGGSKTYTRPTGAVGLAAVVGGVLSVAVVLASWYLVPNGSGTRRVQHPVRLMIDELVEKTASMHAFDLRALQPGYGLRITNDSQPTWLPAIARRDFIQNVPGGRYVSFSPTFKQVPPGSEVVALPYFVLLVLDREDAQARRFTLRLEQTGHAVEPPVYFSNGLNIQVP
jgi:hypothetical protein